jgi:LuxR family maltose regulon positive regulatory protein
MANSAPTKERSTVLPSSVLFETKLSYPPERPEHLVRTGLLGRVDAARDARLILVRAAAGYGKTTLLSQWARAASRPTAWLTLDGGDRHLPSFWAYVIAAVGRAADGATGEAAAALSSGAPIEAVVLPRLVRGLRRTRAALALVLDDYHEASTPAVDASLTRLVATMPAGMLVLVGARNELAGESLGEPVAAGSPLRAVDGVAELGEEQLRFSDGETRAWLRDRMGLDLSDASIATLMRRTDGWVAGLYLTSLQLAKSADPDVAVKALRDVPRVIAEFLTEETVQAWPPAVRGLMRRASSLKRFSGALLESVAGSADAGGTLRRLERANLMLTVGDDGWYRLHPLLGGVLRAELRAEDPRAETVILAGAARWHARRHDWAEAIDCALEAHAWDLAAELIGSSTNEFWDGADELMPGFLDRLPGEVVAADPTLLLTRAWLAAGDGDWQRTQRSLDAALTLRASRPLPYASPSVEASAAIIRGLFPLGGIESMRLNAWLARRLVPEGHPLRGIADVGLAYAAHLAGDVEEARRRFAECAATLAEPILRAGAATMSALYDIDRGDLAAAEAWVAEAASTIARHELGGWPRASFVETGRGALLAAQGRTAAALGHLERGAASPASWHSSDHLESIIRLGEIELDLGLTEAAAAHFGEAREICARLGGAARRYLTRIPDVAAPAPSGPRGRLTQAELRVIELLASTSLTVPQLATRLHRSVNTVKSQVRSIYWKLDVGSRDAAVRATRPGTPPG